MNFRAFLLLAVLLVSCDKNDQTLPAVESNDVPQCEQYMTAIEREQSDKVFLRASMKPMDTIDFWHLYLNGQQQLGEVTLNRTNDDDCLMAAYFNDTGRYLDTLDIFAGSRMVMSIGAVPSHRFLNAVYPISIPALYARLTSADGDPASVRLVFRHQYNPVTAFVVQLDR